MTTESGKEKVFLYLYCSKPQGAYICLGILFLTDKNLYFVPLTITQYSSTSAFTGGIIGGLFGGVVGSINDYNTNQSRLKEANAEIERVMKSQFGSSLSERINSNPLKNYAVQIPKDNIKSLSVMKNNKILCQTLDGQSYQIYCDNIQQKPTFVKLITEYPSYISNTIPLDSKQWGLELDLPKPAQLAESIKKCENIPPEIITAVSNYEVYLDCLYPLLREIPDYILESPNLLVLNIKIGHHVSRLISSKQSEYWFDRAIQIDERCVDAWIAKGRINNSEKFFDKALSIDPQSKLAWYYKGINFYQNKDFNKALPCLDSAIQLDSGFFYPWLYKGVILYQLKKFEDALKCFNDAIKIEPGIADSWFYKGMCEVKIKKTDDAINSFEVCLNAKRRIKLVQNSEYVEAQKLLNKLKR